MSLETTVKCPQCKGTGKCKVADPARLRSKRESAGLSARDMAKRLGFSAPYICDIELGRRGCTPKVLEAYESL
jgi:predicted transcriptional regulator